MRNTCPINHMVRIALTNRIGRDIELGLTVHF